MDVGVGRAHRGLRCR